MSWFKIFTGIGLFDALDDAYSGFNCEVCGTRKSKGVRYEVWNLKFCKKSCLTKYCKENKVAPCDYCLEKVPVEKGHKFNQLIFCDNICEDDYLYD